MSIQKKLRIMIFGRPGGGKSTLSHILHNKLNIPLYHLDKYFYKENWIENDYNAFLEIQRNLVDKSQWIIDGNCLSSLEMRYKKATHCIYFNIPRYICYWRVLKRYFKKDKQIHDRARGCKETINTKLLKYMWEFEKRVNPKIKHLKNKYPKVTFIEINSDEDLKLIDKSLL